MPEQPYRLRVHEYGDCSSENAGSVGEPLGETPDLVEFPADLEGWADIAITHRGHSVGTGANSLLGRAVVLYGDVAAVGCGTIGIARSPEVPPPSSEDLD
jgi:hypothetical protein